MLKGIVMAPSTFVYRHFIEVAQLDAKDYPMVTSRGMLEGIDRRTNVFQIEGFMNHSEYDDQLLYFVESRFIIRHDVKRRLIENMGNRRGKYVPLSMLSMEDIILLAKLHHVRGFMSKSMMDLYAEILPILERERVDEDI